VLRRFAALCAVVSVVIGLAGCKKKTRDIVLLPETQTPMGQEYKDPDGAFSLRIPEGWRQDKETQAPGIVAVFVPEGAEAGTNISIQAENVGATALEYYSHLNEQNSKRVLNGYQPLGEREAANLDGAPAAVARFRFDRGGQVYESLRYLVINHGEAYQITLTASQGSLKGYEDAYYGLLNSWKFSQPWSETPPAPAEQGAPTEAKPDKGPSAPNAKPEAPGS